MLNSTPLRSLGRKTVAVAALALVAAGTTLTLRAADHADSPDTSEGNLDVNDLYVFSRGDNLVFAMTVNPLLAPGSATTGAAFNPEGLYEFKLDVERDGVEDAVIQIAVAGTGADQIIDVRGPVAVSSGGGTSSTLMDSPSIRTTLGATTTASGMSVFAGPRDDPFFVALFGDMSVTSVLNAAFSAALGEQVGADDEQSFEFNPDAIDDLAGLNVLAIVIELPKATVASALGIGSTDAFYAWATTSIR